MNHQCDKLFFLSSRRADAVKNVVSIQKTKIQEAQASEDTQDLFKLKILSTDLEKLHDEIFAVVQLGILWTTNYGCSREELDEWRRFSIKLLQDLTEKKKIDDLESTTIVEAYRANVKLKKLTMIKKAIRAE